MSINAWAQTSGAMFAIPMASAMPPNPSTGNWVLQWNPLTRQLEYVNFILPDPEYQVPVLYAAGILLDSPSQTVEYNGVVYAPLPSALPFTTSGVFEMGSFRVIQGVTTVDLTTAFGNLANTANPALGSALVGAVARQVPSIAALRLLPKTGSQEAFVLGYYGKGDGGGGSYWLDLADVTSPDNGGTVIVAADGGRWKLSYTGVITARQFGARGDGATDDTAAIQRAAAYFGSGGVLSSANGGELLFPRGLYLVSGETLIQQTGVVLVGEGQEATKIRVTADLGASGVFKFDQTRSDYSMVGVGIRGIRIDMDGHTGHGVWMRKPYDGVTLENVYVDNVADAYNGFRIEPDTGVVDTISQTVIMENCCAIHRNASATEPLFYLSNLQEANLTGCKSFGTYETNGKANCYGFELVDCRGITLLGCSSAMALKHGVKLTVLSRPMFGITVINHTWETINGCLRADGLAGTGEVNGLCVINPRAEGDVSNASGTFDLNTVRLSLVDSGTHSVNLDANCVSNLIQTSDTSVVVDAGDSTTVLGRGNQALTRYKIDAGGLRVTSRGVLHLDTSNLYAQLYSSGSLTLQADYPFTPNDVGVLLAVNRGGTVALSRVVIGAGDSGGVGYRMVRVAN